MCALHIRVHDDASVRRLLTTVVAVIGVADLQGVGAAAPHVVVLYAPLVVWGGHGRRVGEARAGAGTAPRRSRSDDGPALARVLRRGAGPARGADGV